MHWPHPMQNTVLILILFHTIKISLCQSNWTKTAKPQHFYRKGSTLTEEDGYEFASIAETPSCCYCANLHCNLPPLLPQKLTPFLNCPRSLSYARERNVCMYSVPEWSGRSLILSRITRGAWCEWKGSRAIRRADTTACPERWLRGVGGGLQISWLAKEIFTWD